MGGEKGQNQQYVPKHITVDLQGQSTKTFAGSLSKRRQMRVVDENGNAFVGFFTQDTTVDLWGIANARLREQEIPKGYEKLDLIRQYINNQSDQQRQSINDFLRAVDPGEKAGEKDKWTVEKASEQWSGILASLQDSFHISEKDADELTALANKDRQIVGAYLLAVIDSLDDAKKVEGQHKDFQLQSANTNINRRNNVFSAFTGMIGQPELSALSFPMTVKDGDKVFHGSFMVHAKGVSFDTLHDSAPYKNKKLSVAPAALRQSAALRVADYLCANIDRNPFNMFYQVDNSDPKNVVITGVQGIDNDASFGTINGKGDNNRKVYDYMSLLDDITVIDKKTADAVLAMKKEDVEGQVRLAGLSRNEVEAAKTRLELLQEKIRSKKDIKIMNSDSDWAKLIEDGKIKDSLISATEDYVQYNIFGGINGQILDHNNKIKPDLDNELADIIGGESGEIDQGDEIEAVDDSIPTVKATFDNEQYALDAHIEFFKYLQTSLNKDLKYNKYNPDHDNGGYQKLEEQMQSVIDWMQEKSRELASNESKDQLLYTKDRHELVAKLGELSRAASDYAAANEKNAFFDIISTVNTAKNIKAYADFAREAVRDDVRETIKSGYLHELEQNYHAQGKAMTNHTFSTLTDRVKGLSGRCTKYYTRMINALGSGDLSGNTDFRQKLAKCKEMEAAAKGYLQHKIPKGTEDGLKPKERDRVQFARDILEYAEQNRKFINYQIGQTKDYAGMHAFHAAVDGLVEKYKKAGEENKNAAAEEILNYGEQFKKGFTNILEVSDKYAKIDDMQSACAFMACGGVAEYMKIYLQCANQKNHTDLTNAYEALGMSQDYSRRAKEMVENGMERYNASANQRREVPDVLVPSEQKKPEKLSELLSGM